jgi:ketosteroid isomerase-like protein
MLPSRHFFVSAVCLTVGLSVIGFRQLRSAGTNAEEEAAIRKAIAASAGHVQDYSLPDSVFWSGAYKRPTVGKETPEEVSGANAVSSRVPGSVKTTSEPIRIVVAESRDLAYEYGKYNLQFDLKSGEHVGFDGGVLRVWQKQNGEWKMAATFVRPYVP